MQRSTVNQDTEDIVRSRKENILAFRQFFLPIRIAIIFMAGILLFNSCRKKEDIQQYIRFETDSSSYHYDESSVVRIEGGASIFSFPADENIWYIIRSINVVRMDGNVHKGVFSMNFYYITNAAHYKERCLKRKYMNEFEVSFSSGNYAFLERYDPILYPQGQAKTGMAIFDSGDEWRTMPFDAADTTSYSQSNSSFVVSSSTWIRNKDGLRGMHLTGTFHATLHYNYQLKPPIHIKNGTFSVFIPVCLDE